ncbi:reductive dehalogenase [Chloroflexota bacterium]
MSVDIMSKEVVAKGASRYVVGELERFDEKNAMFKRIEWDPNPKLTRLYEKYYGVVMPKEDKPGYTLVDLALRNAAWWLELGFAKSIRGGNEGFLAWESEVLGPNKPPTGLKIATNDLTKITKIVKKAARFFGASLVGVCELDRRWLYSHYYHNFTKEYGLIKVPEEYKYAIAIATEMDYRGLEYSPTTSAGAVTGFGYTKQAFVAGLLAQFIRGLGYKAIPQGNDTSLSIPIAIDAGLGELGRNGLLITEEFGPRVRISKIFTDLPLVPDEPIEFGVWEFCCKCRKCAETCPSKSIIYDEPTEEIPNISNMKGLFRWPVNGERCLAFWVANDSDCATCITVCPFNKLPGWLHNSVRWGVKHTRWLDSFFLKMDGLLGYGKLKSAKTFWDS